MKHKHLRVVVNRKGEVRTYSNNQSLVAGFLKHYTLCNSEGEEGIYKEMDIHQLMALDGSRRGQGKPSISMGGGE